MSVRLQLDVLKSEEPCTVLRLLGNLEDKFNGDVFSIPTEAKLTAAARVLSVIDNVSMFGRITHGPKQGSVVDKTLEFVYRQLPIWRDKPHREAHESEEALHGQLCKHLNAAARRGASRIIEIKFV